MLRVRIKCPIMMEPLASAVPDVAVVRRMLFATKSLPPDCPQYWDVIRDFATRGSSITLESGQVQALMENTQFFSAPAFHFDHQLQRELTMLPRPPDGQPLGVILISPKTRCCICGGNLITRIDRPSAVTLYTNNMGTAPAKHYRRHCHKKGCDVVQHYGFFSASRFEGVQYDEDWANLQHFISSQETAFELSMLERFDAELLIGQVSHKQKAEIYNHIHGYGCPQKKCSSQHKERKVPIEARYCVAF